MSAWTQKANKNSGEGFEKAPPGNHPAVLVAMIDMGTQEENFQGQTKWQHRAFFVYELVNERMKTVPARNHVIAIDLTVSLNEKAKLRKWIEARTGKSIPDGVEYDISQEVGQPCLLNVVMKGDFPKIESVSSVPKGMTVPAPQNTPTTLSLDEIRNGAKVPDWIPWLYGERLDDVIKRCQEFAEGGSEPRPAAPSAPPSAPTTAAPPSAPPPPNGQATPKFWVDLGNGQVTPQPVDQSGIGHFLMEKGLTNQAQVCVVGTNDWKPALAFGIKLPF